jgi:hypothetical protein
MITLKPDALTKPSYGFLLFFRNAMKLVRTAMYINFLLLRGY